MSRRKRTPILGSTTNPQNFSGTSTSNVSLKKRVKPKIDPIQIAFSQELKRFIGYVDRVQKESQMYIEKSEEESPARLSNTIFNLWNNYCHKLPEKYFASKLISTGDYLYQVNEYDVARQHCYGYYLRLLKERSVATDYVDIYFPTGFKDEAAAETCQAIFGNGLCTLAVLKGKDPFLDEEGTVVSLLEVLDDFRKLTQHLIPHEHLCWLVFNGTVHMFRIAKLLVDRGHTKATLEFLIWCCVCMESVIPLMTLKFLAWRGTLYASVCECYLDLNQSYAAELFARRALQKIHQLAKIEEQSLSEATEESEAIFREVTIKLSAIIFRRIVFESRRPKKIIHRPKTRQNLKELQMQPYPRTSSEKLALEMFEGQSAQLFAIISALSEPSRRICQISPPPLDTAEGGDVLMDVWGELVLGGYELISRAQRFSTESMIALGRAGSNEISLSGAMRFIKLIFTYEFWDYYDLTITKISPVLEEMEDSPEVLFYRNTLDLLNAMRNISSHNKRITRPSTCFGESTVERGISPAMSMASGAPNGGKSDQTKVENMSGLRKLCAVLISIKESGDTMFVQKQSDMLVDSTLLLLHCLKDHFSRLISASTAKQYVVADNKEQMLDLLKKCHVLSLWLNLYSIDPLIPGELAYKTALLHEAIAQKLESSLFTKKMGEKRAMMESSLTDGINTLKESIAALESVRNIKSISTRPDCDPAVLVVDPSLTKTEGELSHSISVGDLQLEMICLQQRMRFKLIAEENHDQVFETCNKNTLFHAVTHMQLASVQKKSKRAIIESHLRESFQLLQKSWNEERRLYAAGQTQLKEVPPPPILTSRTSSTMTFRPAPYTPPDGQKVKWYRLYGRSSSGSNIKVRLNDKLYPGLATEVQALPNAELSVSGLTPYEKYQFAVAAFDENGKLISKSIGDSSKPILASPPYSNLTAFGHLIQICHTQGVLDVATEACNVMWNFFVLPHTTSKTDISIPSCTYPRLNSKHVNGASITTIRHLIESILVAVDIQIREGALFCDVTCDRGPLKPKQLARIGLCEKLLVAIELAGRINDTQLGIQSIIQTYGLLAPIIHYNIMCYPALKVLLYCHAALTELPGVIKQRKYAGNIQHMAGVITYYLSKTLHQWGENNAATLVSENGHELLAMFDNLYDELSEQSHAITPSNRKKPVKRAEALVKCNIKDMVQEPGGAPMLKSDTLKAFEAHVLRHNAVYPINNSGDPEFTGQEDFNLLYAAVANLTSTQAQREVYKFRRRSKFLELYVRVLEKALIESRPELVFEWCGEASAWLTRRNELLIAPRLTGVGKDTKTAKANIEKLTATKGSDANITRSKGDTRGTGKNIKKEGTPKVKPFKLWGTPDDSKVRAAELLRAILPDVWRRSYRLQRLRLITREEMPWRAQMNLTLAVACYKQFTDKLNIKIKNLSEHKDSDSVGDYDELPCDMFAVSHVGSMIHSKDQEESPELNLPVSLEMEREKTNLTQFRYSNKGSTSSVNSRYSKLGLMSDRAGKELKLSYSHYLYHTFQSMTQALVLAHRGAHWALLQNIAAHLWRLVMDLQMKMKTISTQIKEILGLTEQTINDIILKPMYLTSEFMLDFVENVIGSHEDIQDAAMLAGKPEDIDGGSSLQFDKFDDTSFVHIRWIHRYIMETLKILYANSQFEKLVHIGIRFNNVTNNVFGDQTLPLIIYSKRKLADRVAEYNEPWHTETSSVSVHSTVTPVQAGDNVSPQVVEALRLVSVPLDPDTDLKTLNDVLNVRSHTALSLQYCRQLLLCYLSGYGKGCVKQGASPVSSFHPGTAAATRLYDKPGDLVVHPLSASSHGVIISAYEKTIEMLQIKGKSDLVIQAMRELGDILFHSGNIKGAFKWWCDALDTLLHTPNLIQNWYAFSNNSELLLNKCQIWGCLLGACIASNISQYVMYHSIDARVDTCLLSASLCKALFHASLPHPTSDYEYATYEIGDGFNIPAVIPGVDILSDQFRCSGSTLVACLHYVADTLIRHQYALQALPVLTLYHYVAMSMCLSTTHVITARILKVQALCQLSMLSEALKLWCVVSQNEALPPPPATHGNNISNKTENYIPVTAMSLANVPVFDNSEPLNSYNNLKAVDAAIKSKLPPVTDDPFTANLSALAQLTHSRLLLALATVTNVIPDNGAPEGSLPHTKYKLCSAAEIMLTMLSHSADKEEAHYSEIDISVSSYEVLCSIALQKQLGSITVALANHGLVLLQRAHALDRRQVASYDEMCSRRRLDGLAWLQLKCRMIEGLSLMTTLYGGKDCKEVCDNTLQEANLYNSCEIYSWLSLKKLILDITESSLVSVEGDIMKELAKSVEPSCLGAFVGVSTILYSSTKFEGVQDATSRYNKIKDLINYHQHLYYGGKENIHSYMTPISALVVLLQSDWKLADINDKIVSGAEDVDPDLAELEDVISRTLLNSSVESVIRSQLLIRLGVVMRARWERDPTPERLVQAINVLCDCITSTDYDLVVVREAYLEIAFITSIISNGNKSEGTKQVNIEKRAAWSAIRSAALCNATANIIKCLEQKTASQNIIDSKLAKKLPHFAGLELNRELSTKLLTPHSRVSHPTPPSNLSWVKVISYLDTLKRDLQTQGYGGFCPLSSPGLSSRISHLQDFLSNNMPGWTAQCNPPRISRNISYLTVGRQGGSTPSSRESSVVTGDSSVAADVSAEGGIVLQWFKPRLQTLLQDTEKDIVMFYTFNCKAVKTYTPVFNNNSYTGLLPFSSHKLQTVHAQVEFAYAKQLIEEDGKKEITVTTPAIRTGSIHASKTDSNLASPEPYQASETEEALVHAVEKFLSLDKDISKEVLTQEDMFTPIHVNQLENLLSLNMSVPQHNSTLCRWLISFRKVIHFSKNNDPSSRRSSLSADTSTKASLYKLS